MARKVAKLPNMLRVKMKKSAATSLNPLLHWLFLDHDIIFYFYNNIEKKIKKNLSKVLNTFESTMENGANAPFSIILEQMLHVP